LLGRFGDAVRDVVFVGRHGVWLWCLCTKGVCVPPLVDWLAQAADGRQAKESKGKAAWDKRTKRPTTNQNEAENTNQRRAHREKRHQERGHGSQKEDESAQ
jgi:hypothetical protein